MKKYDEWQALKGAQTQHDLPYQYNKLEQLEHLHSQDNPYHQLITHTKDSYRIPSQNQTKPKLQI